MRAVSVRVRSRGGQRAVEAGVSAANLNAAADTAATATGQLLFGIVQGATFEDLRRSSAQAIVDLGALRLFRRLLV